MRCEHDDKAHPQTARARKSGRVAPPNDSRAGDRRFLVTLQPPQDLSRN
ncbi:jg17147, partial [Pararge aegeria aegeria]